MSRVLAWLGVAAFSAVALLMILFTVADIGVGRWVNLPLDLVFLAVSVSGIWWLHPRLRRR